MIPSDAFTSTPQVSAFQTPYSAPYNPTSQVVLGGVAIGNASLGRQVKNWTAYKDGTFIRIIAAGDASPSYSVSAPDAITVSLAFDGNMGVVLAWAAAADAKLYYYDTLTSGYITRTFAGVTSCRVCVDDARDFYTSASDVIFAYTIGGNLYWRQQRDRYDVERLVGATTKKLIRAGPNIGSRLQFELI